MTPVVSPPARPGHTQRGWAITGVGALVLLGLVAALAVKLWMPSDDQLAKRAAQALTDALGTPVSIGALHWQLLPQAQVELLDVAIGQRAPSSPHDAAPATPTRDGNEAPPHSPVRDAADIALQHVTLFPALSLASLWTRTVHLSRVEVDGAHVPQRTLARLKLNTTAPRPADGGMKLAPIPLDTLVWRRVSWQPRHGAPFLLSGEATFDAQWRPRTADVRLLEAATLTEVTVRRDDAASSTNAHWAVTSRVGGGTVDGTLALQESGSELVLSGQLTPKHVEVASAMAAFNRRSPVGGKASGSTVVSARAAQSAGLSALVVSLHTDTRFTMGASHLTRFDLGKAVRSLGADTLGQTPLNSITGQMTTRNTPDGMVTRFVDVKARSGALSASGEATVANGLVDATLAVDLVDGVVGVPLRITGPTRKVTVSVPPLALAGATVGTVVAPGVGTAVGARLGAAIGQLFGGDTKSPSASGAAGKPSAPSAAKAPPGGPRAR